MLTDQDIQKMVEVFQPKFNALEESILNLAIMTKKRFDEVDSKIETLESKLEDHIAETHQNFFNLDTKVNDISTRENKIEEKLEPLYTVYSIMQREIQQLNYRMDKVEEKVGNAN